MWARAAVHSFPHTVTQIVCAVTESRCFLTLSSQNVTESLRSIVPPEDFSDSHAPGVVSRLLDQLTPSSFLLVLGLLTDSLLGMLQRSMDIHELVERVLDVAEASRSSGGIVAATAGGGSSVASSSDPKPPPRMHSAPLNIDKIRAVNSGVVAVVNTRLQSHVAKLVNLRAGVRASCSSSSLCSVRDRLLCCATHARLYETELSFTSLPLLSLNLSPVPREDQGGGVCTPVERSHSVRG